MTESSLPTEVDDCDADAWDEATQPAGEYDPEIKDRIKVAIDLASLIGETCKPDGGSGVRFDHGNKHPSNQGNCVSITTNSKGELAWHCFQCEKKGDSISGGDCFAWMADRYGLDMVSDFSEIVRIAADYAGIVLPTTKEDEDTTRVFECLTEAARAYHNNLTEEMYDDIESKWGITRETCNTMLIGSCKTDGSEKDVLRKAGFLFDEMLSTGLIKKNKTGTSFFAGRYTFPYWARGRIEYIIGRQTIRTPDKRVKNKATGEWEARPPSKYTKLQTNNGSDYTKHISEYVRNIIFGIDSLNTDKDFCLITEGIADAIMAIQEEFPCVSPVTTKFKYADYPRILKLVRKFKKVYVCMDSEKSGEGLAGAYGVAKHLIDNGVDAYIVEIPRPEGVDKIDLADYLRDHSVESFEQLMVIAKPPPEGVDPPADVFLNEKNKFMPAVFAQWLISDSELHFKNIREGKVMIYYQDGIYHPDGETLVGEVTERIMKAYATNNSVSEVIGHIRRSTGIDRLSIDSNLQIINIENGLYNIETNELKPHTPDYVSLHKSRIVYDPDATCPCIDQFFKEVLRKKDIAFMYELFGYALLAQKRLDTAVLFEGTGSNGKSRMIDLLDAFVGEDVTIHVTPSQLSGDDAYASAALVGKLLNTIDDLGNTPLRDLGVFKSIVSGAEIRAREIYHPAFKFKPTVLCVFGCNDVPVTNDVSDGFFRRMVTIPFLNKFEIGVEGTDENLIDKLTTSLEISGLFNRAVMGVKTIMKAHRFTGVGTIADKRREYMYASSPIAQFVDEMCNITDPDDLIDKDELYNQFVLWSRDHKKKTESKGALTVYLEQLGCMKCRPRGDDGERYQAYSGISIKGGV